MAKYVFLVMINPEDGQDEVLNTWLDEHHIPEVLQIQGFRRATRFELAPEDAGNVRKPNRYMHFYEIETDDLAAVKAALSAPGAYRTPLTPALDLTTMFTAFYRLKE